MISEVSKDLRETNDKIGEFVERKVTAEDQLRRIDIRAPQDGMVLQSTVHTVGGVINASAYRAFLLFDAAEQFGRDDYRRAAERNLNYVLQSQRLDGSWYYATDGLRNFIDHFHTCFIIKALAKIEALIDHEGCTQAIESGVRYYVEHLFDENGLPRPFSAAPRLTIYKRELYDYAECINLAVLLNGRFDALDARLQATVDDLLSHWQKPDGSFRSRRLMFGWDNVPMHRWAQAQVFRSLCALSLVQRRS